MGNRDRKSKRRRNKNKLKSVNWRGSESYLDLDLGLKRLQENRLQQVKKDRRIKMTVFGERFWILNLFVREH